MKNTKLKMFLFAVSISTIVSCRSYQEAWLNPQLKTVTKLPKLSLSIDTISVEKAHNFSRWNTDMIPSYANPQETSTAIIFNDHEFKPENKNGYMTPMGVYPYTTTGNHLPDYIYYLSGSFDPFYSLKRSNYPNPIINDAFLGNVYGVIAGVYNGNKLNEFKEIPIRTIEFQHSVKFQFSTYAHYTQNGNGRGETKVEYFEKLGDFIYPGTIGIPKGASLTYSTFGDLKNKIKEYPNYYWYKDSSFVNYVSQRPVDEIVQLGYNTNLRGLAINDAQTMLNNYFQNNLISQNGENKGSIEIYLGKKQQKFNGLWLIPSTLTIFTINLLGFPMGNQNCSVELNVVIRNKENKIIKQYKETGIGKAWSAAYWGFQWKSARLTRDYGITSSLSRAVNTFALTDALNRLQKDIEHDYSEIMKALK